MARGFNVRILNLDTPAKIQAEMDKIGASAPGIEIMTPKASLRAIKLEGLNFAASNILKQEMLSRGGETVASRVVYSAKQSDSDVLLLGTLRHYQDLVRKLHMQPFKSLRAIATEVEQALARYAGEELQPLVVADRTFNWGERTYVMGVVNVTPDSFSGDGLGRDAEGALAQAERMIEEGADLIDVGGESTRPGSEPVGSEEELRRVIPVIEGLVQRTSVPISIDTYKGQVAEEALVAGAHLVNDVWGLRLDPSLAEVVGRHRVPVVVMHNRSRPKDAAQTERLGGRYLGVEYKDLMGDIIWELRESMALALEAGVEREKIIVDPGIGFGKTLEQNLQLVAELSELKVLGRPVLLGPSRKSFIGYTLDLPPEERMEGTTAAVAIGIANGADIVRVHDVKEMVRVTRMTDAIVRRQGAKP
ncbi:MAG: dihydropteroate synthase [Chloroflexi bacterium B3_Chlor]|nr:MAG: dihydropteroate synthase [Chloroflexi bacterium B3_Chlor]